MHTDDSERYLKRKFHKDRSPFGVFVDMLALRLIFFLASMRCFARWIPTLQGRIILSTISLACFCILLRIVSRLRYERFVSRELGRVRRELFLSGLWRYSDEALQALSKPLRKEQMPLLILRRIEPADGNALLDAARKNQPLFVLSTAGFTPAAHRFSETTGTGLHLIDTGQLVNAAEQQGLLPSAEAARAEMACRYDAKRQQRQRSVSLAFSNTFPGKYLCAAALLILLSFFTGYGLYYRLLAMLSTCIALLGAALSRRGATHSVGEENI